MFDPQVVRGRQKKPSYFSSDFVTSGTALLGIVAASAKREALNLEACRDTSLNGVLGVWLRLGILDFRYVGRTPGEG